MYLISLCVIMKGDVYPVETTDDFPVSQVLDAHWGVLDDEDVSNRFCSLSYYISSSIFSSCYL